MVTIIGNQNIICHRFPSTSFDNFFDTCKIEGPIRQTREGGSEWEPIKILLEGDANSNKMNTAFNTRLRLTTQVGQVHTATEVLLDLGTNKQPSKPKHTNTHNGNLHGVSNVFGIKGGNKCSMSEMRIVSGPCLTLYSPRGRVTNATNS
jgi:hypothetical protein